jgi:hypothetical protein
LTKQWLQFLEEGFEEEYTPLWLEILVFELLADLRGEEFVVN